MQDGFKGSVTKLQDTFGEILTRLSIPFSLSLIFLCRFLLPKVNYRCFDKQITEFLASQKRKN